MSSTNNKKVSPFLIQWIIANAIGFAIGGAFGPAFGENVGLAPEPAGAEPASHSQDYPGSGFAGIGVRNALQSVGKLEA